MKILIAKEPLRRILRWIQAAFLAIGVSLLAYCGYVHWDSWSFQKAERRQFEQLLPAAHPAVFPASGGLIGRLDIPRLGLSVMVIEGSSQSTLRRAAGHISGTGLPGQGRNIGISAHRDTFFRPLRNIQKGDIITVTTLDRLYRYRVVSTRIVSPSDVAVLDSGENEILTLVTCYPFYFVGAAPDRFIVRAERGT